MNCSPLRRGFLISPLAAGLASIALSTAEAQLPSPTPDGGYPNNNTAEGTNALFNLTTGTDNTAIGFQALLSNTSGLQNTANGSNSLVNNISGQGNTAIGYSALLSNTTGNFNTATGANALLNNNSTDNTATGTNALLSNTTGSGNTATGTNALKANTIGNRNTAAGQSALLSNANGVGNTATGFQALVSNTSGSNNTAEGVNTLKKNTKGNYNVANGLQALFNNSTGSSNIAVGFNAGFNLTTGSNNIDIGNTGVASEANTIRIGKVGTQTATFIAGVNGTAVTGEAVSVSSTGQLGVAPSSERFKEAIKPIDKASEPILALKPVTFRYKAEVDPDGIPQFGLIAEEVEKVNPDLVVHEDNGKPFTVRYEAVNALLLNEFLKEHRRVQELKIGAARQEAKIAQQQRQIEVLTATVQRVTARLESREHDQRVVSNQINPRSKRRSE